MITVLRRLRKRFLAQNKFSKYLIYAFGEILLVMIGILLAFQVSTWNDERIKIAQEVKILSELINDVQKEIERLES